MCKAIVRGLRSSPDVSDILAYDINNAAAMALAENNNVTVASSPRQVTEEADIVILSVKPHIQRLVLQEIAPSITSGKRPGLLSIAAGRTLNDIFQDLCEFGVKECPPLIRVMPNVNAQIGMSMSAICYCPGTPEDIKVSAKNIFDTIGECIELPEGQFGIFSALAGASPAWFFQILDSFARAGVKHGLTKKQALQAITQSMLGSAKMMQVELEEGTAPSQLIDRVCSPGGTTIAGLLAAQAAGLDSALVRAVDATVKRDQELGG
jgi:pyrroline-5-carboxylate reductase